ncbi:hypothetical protein [Pantoea ananatis]|uniref:hypothetical protein n=1 Tax=Pantoea ananas TaxID=553 RepID=UPI0015EC8DA6|nr:hypothetical protein [Pantoea ananatis]
MKILSRVLLMLLSLVMLTGLAGCAVEKGASGQKVVAPKTQEEKSYLTDGKDREK